MNTSQLVEAGQVYSDNDPRTINPQGLRYLVVEQVQQGRAYCRSARTHKITQISISRMGNKLSTGYTLVTDPKVIKKVKDALK